MAVIPDRDAMRDDVTDRHAGTKDVRGQIEYFGIALVADDQAHVLVEHAQAVRHVIEGDIEAVVLLLQLLCGALALGDVLVGADLSSVGERLVSDRNQRPSAKRRTIAGSPARARISRRLNSSSTPSGL